ncbi:MAG: AAA family ATPase [Fervidicoccaceae archaeon]
MSGGKRIVAVAGLPGSGKSTVAKLLGPPVISMGDVVRREVRKRGLREDLENVMKIARELRRERGAGAVAELVLDELRRIESKLVVVEGVRSSAELDVLAREAECIKVVAVHASPETRFERLRGRGRAGDPRSWEEFVRRDAAELEFGVSEVIALADVMIVNESTLEELSRSVERAREVLEECSGRYAWRSR